MWTTILLGAVSALVLWLVVRSMIHEATIGRLWAAHDVLAHDLKVSRAGLLLPVDTSPVPGAVNQAATPPPAVDAYATYLEKLHGPR